MGLSPSPLPTSPLFLRSMCQLSVSPAAFLRVKANTALPCLMAVFFSAGSLRAELMASKAADEGNLSVGDRVSMIRRRRDATTARAVLERHGGDGGG